MNNVTYFPSVVNYPEINVALLREAFRTTREARIEVEALYIKTDYLPTAYNHVIQMASVLEDAELKLREVVLTLDNKVRLHVPPLRALQTELKTSTDEDRAEILEDIVEAASKIINVIRAEYSTLNHLQKRTNVALDRATTAKYQEQLEKDIARVPPEIEEIKERRATLDEKRNVLTEAMALIEAKGFAQVGMETMLNAQEIQKLAMAGPEVAVVEKAIELAQQALEKLESVINYNNLMEARNALRKQINQLNAVIRDKSQHLGMIELKKELIIAAHDFDNQRMRYSTEFNKFVASTQSFLGVYQAIDVQDDNTISQLVNDSLALAKHLNVLA
ncbi:alpha-xenorhabdolysin family binary toxin subunit B [Pseudomonas sp. Pseu.R1]|uniref:alpha-xenorhabdolysin family binary toxin subunit B n=1 Tax=Pseudomonas sp. Pseu.R1 TaxID=3379818 RepID=UPI003B9439BA